MALWLVRAGRNGEYEDANLQHQVASIAWDVGDLTGVQSREQMTELMRQEYPHASDPLIINHTGQVWRFRSEIKQGDVIAMPLKGRSAIAFGNVTGPYAWRPDLPEGVQHTLPVKWVRDDVPRPALEQDLLYSLGAIQTVCKITRHNAEERVRAVMNNQPDPGPPDDDAELGGGDGEVQDETTTLPVDLEQVARDQIQRYIITHFKGHGLTRLVDAVLRAEGYHTLAATPGPDGGIDILAGRGTLGLEGPSLAVQVKSGVDSVDVKILRELQGAMQSFGAKQGLLVAWGGFKSSTVAEARKQFFTVRLWDANDLLAAITTHYERLSEELQAELPLKRIWALVEEQGE